MEVNLLYLGVVDFGFGRAQNLEDSDGLVLCGFAEGSFADDVPNFLQPAMMMFVLVIVVMALMLMTVLVAVVMVVLMLMTMLIGLLLPEFLAWKLFFSGGNHVKFHGTDAAALHAGDLQAGIYPERLHSAGEHLGLYSGVQQCAQEHVAADTGEALKIGN